MFYLILMLIHAYMFMSFKCLYNELKTREDQNKSIALYEYGKVILKERNKLNDNYECPMPCDIFEELNGKVRESLANREALEMEANIYETLGQKNNTSIPEEYLALHELKIRNLKAPNTSDSSNISDESPIKNHSCLFNRIKNSH